MAAMVEADVDVWLDEAQMTLARRARSGGAGENAMMAMGPTPVSVGQAAYDLRELTRATGVLFGDVLGSVLSAHVDDLHDAANREARAAAGREAELYEIATSAQRAADVAHFLLKQAVAEAEARGRRSGKWPAWVERARNFCSWAPQVARLP